VNPGDPGDVFTTELTKETEKYRIFRKKPSKEINNSQRNILKVFSVISVVKPLCYLFNRRARERTSR
jgi:hypothetical protein